MNSYKNTGRKLLKANASIWFNKRQTFTASWPFQAYWLRAPTGLRILHSAQTVFMCFVWIWEQAAIISLYNINWLVFITETNCVHCAVRIAFKSVSLKHKIPAAPHCCSCIPVNLIKMSSQCCPPNNFPNPTPNWRHYISSTVTVTFTVTVTVTQCTALNPCRRFGTTHRSYPEDGTDRSYRNVALTLHAV